MPLASIPIILHLISRSKRKRIDFPSILFLKNLKKERFLWLKIKELLLLVLRTLFIIFLILSAAGPITRAEIPFLKGEGSFALIIDDSYSTQRCFKEIINTSLKFLKKLKKNAELGIFTFSGLSKINLSPKEAYQVIKSLKPSYHAETVKNALIRAILFLEKKRVKKEIYIFTDGEKNSLEFLNSFDLPPKISVKVMILSKGIEKNAGISDITSLPLYPLSGEKIKPVAVIENKGSKGVKINVVLNAQGIKEEKVLYIKKGEKKRVEFNTMLDSGAGYVKISDDEVSADNKRFFYFSFKKRRKILLLKKEGNTLYLENAVSPGGKLYDLEIKNYKKLSFEKFKDYDALFLYALPAEFIKSVLKFYKKPVFIFLPYQEEIIIPGYIKKTEKKKVHGILRLKESPEFLREEGKEIYFWKYLGAETENLIYLMEFENKLPFVGEAKDRPVYFFFSLPEPSFTNIQFKPIFLILIQRLLAKATESISKTDYLVGEVIKMPAEKNTAFIETPVSSYRIISRVENKKRYFFIEKTDIPGFYRIDDRKFVVNVSKEDGYYGIFKTSKRNIEILSGNVLIEKNLTFIFLLITFLLFIGELIVLRIK